MNAIVNLMKDIRHKRELREQGIAEEEERPASQLENEVQEETKDKEKEQN